MYYFNIIDVWPYCVLLLFFWGMSRTKYSSKKKSTAVVLLLIFFNSIRYGVGYDYMNYVNAVYRQKQPFTSVFEPLSQLLLYIAQITHFQVFFIVSTIITLYSIWFFCTKYSPNPYVSIYLYFTFPFFFLSGMSIVRNALAFSMILFAIHFIICKRYIISLLFCIIAFGFHISALVALLIFIPAFLRFNQRASIVLWIFSFFLSKYVVSTASVLFSDLPFFWKLDHYIADIASGGKTITFLINGLAFLIIFFWGRLKTVRSNNIYLMNLILIGVCLWNIFLPLNSVIAERFATYFLLPSVIIFSSLYSSFKNKINRQITVAMSTLIFVVTFYFSISGFVSGKTIRMSNLPYQTVFYHTNYTNILLNNMFE